MFSLNNLISFPSLIGIEKNKWIFNEKIKPPFLEENSMALKNLMPAPVMFVYDGVAIFVGRDDHKNKCSDNNS